MRGSWLGVFCLALTVYLMNGRPHAEVDCVAAPYEAWSLVRHGSLDLRRYPELQNLVGYHIIETADGAWISRRPPGVALTAVPFVAPFAILREQPFSSPAMLQMGKIIAALLVAASAVLFFAVCQRVAPTAAWPATVLLALGTCLCTVASQALWMHGPATFWLCCALACLILPDEATGTTGWWAGLALGLAVMSRPSTALFALATGLSALAQRRWGHALGLLAGGGAPVLGLCMLNLHYFGHPFLGGYAVDQWQTVPPWWLGLGGLLIAPSRGLFIYSPALLLAWVGLVRLSRSAQSWTGHRMLIAAWTMAAAATVLFYARWHDWRGGWCFGPRLLIEILPLACLLFAIGYGSLQHLASRRLALGLVGLSVAVHLVGNFGYRGYESWQHRHDFTDQGMSFFSLQDTQIEAHARALVGKVFPVATQNTLPPHD